MKSFALCLLLCFASGCAGDSRRGDLAADNRAYFNGSGPAKVENVTEAPQQSQLAGVQVAKAEAEANAVKLENGDLRNELTFLKAEKSTLLSEIALVKADNLKLTGVQMDNAKLHSEIAAVQVRNGNLTQELSLLKAEKIQLADQVKAQGMANAALNQKNTQLQEEVHAGRDVIQFTWVHASVIGTIVTAFGSIVALMHRSFNARLKDVDASRARAVAREDRVRAELLEQVIHSPKPGGPHA